MKYYYKEILHDIIPLTDLTILKKKLEREKLISDEDRWYKIQFRQIN